MTMQERYWIQPRTTLIDGISVNQFERISSGEQTNVHLQFFQLGSTYSLVFDNFIAE